jgi:Heterokaryon incompatibility protein (HET)
MSQYYRPICSEAHEIRLVVLHPSTESYAPPVCQLLYTSIGDDVEYEALSYVWGDDPLEKPKQILLDSQPFWVKDNLDDALRHLRYNDTKRILWVDAISIDQNNLEERSHQVQLMRDIFSRCVTSLFWLGPDNGFYKLSSGMEVMKSLVTDEKYIAERSQPSGLSLNMRNEVYPLDAVFKNPKIWNRVWVMQEAACAPRVTLVAGRSTLDWELVASFLGRDKYGPADAFHEPFGHRKMREKRSVTKTFRNPQVVEHQRQVMKKMNEHSTSTLLDVLARFKYTKSTDPRDKVYGLLGLVSEPHGVTVDYRKTIQQVFIDTAEQIILSSGNLDVLCQSPWQSHGNPERMIDLPSWVPDFSSPGNPSLLFAQRSIFNAGANTCHLTYTVLDEKFLRLDGILLGKLESISPSKDDILDRFSILGESTLTQQRVANNQNGAERILTSSSANNNISVYATGESLIQAYWRTLIVDCKAYPIERLNEKDIEAYNTAVQATSQAEFDIGAFPSFKELDGGIMWSRMKSDWKFALTTTGFFAMIPKYCEKLDEIVIVPGAKTPLVVRKVDTIVRRSNEETLPAYILVGSAYVHGFMDGESRSWAENNEIRSKGFVLA